MTTTELTWDTPVADLDGLDSLALEDLLNGHTAVQAQHYDVEAWIASARNFNSWSGSRRGWTLAEAKAIHTLGQGGSEESDVEDSDEEE